MTSQNVRTLLEAHPFLLIPQEAEGLLRQIESSIDLLQLYEHFFPDDFGRHKTSLIPGPECAYSACEEQFFEMVDTHLFPLLLNWIVDDDERTFAYSIPIAPFGLDFEGGYEDTPLGWLLLLYLLALLDEDQIRTAYEDKRLFAIPLERTGEVSQSLLIRRSAAQAGPIANLPSALRMLYYETDTIWLDMNMSNLEISYFCWTTQDINELHTQYRRAEIIQEKANTFCQWLEEEPLTRFSQVARLWNSCIRDDTPKQDPIVLHT